MEWTFPSINRALTIWCDHPGTEATLHKQCWWRLRQYVQRVGYLMLSVNRHWLEYDSVALVALFVGIGFVALIVLGI